MSLDMLSLSVTWNCHLVDYSNRAEYDCSKVLSAHSLVGRVKGKNVLLLDIVQVLVNAPSPSEKIWTAVKGLLQAYKSEYIGDPHASSVMSCSSPNDFDIFTHKDFIPSVFFPTFKWQEIFNVVSLV